MKFSWKAFAGILLLLGLAMPAHAAYPERPITVICPFGAGSGADRILRVALPHLEKAFGQKITVDYKSGGGGVLGCNYFMTTKPDGYTLLYHSQPHITLQSNFQKTAFSNSKLVPVMGVTWRPDIMTVRADSKFKTLGELVEYAKANPGKVTVGNTGSLSSNHLAFATFVKAAGVKLTRIPFESGGKMNAALLGGQIDACFSNMQWLSVYPGKIRALASTAKERPAADIPTFTELGYPTMVDIASLDVLYAKEGTPKEVVDFLKQKVAPLLKDAQVKQEYVAAGIAYGMFSGEEMLALIEQFTRQMADSREIILDSMK